MSDSTIITGQFVRIDQTPASIGERMIALLIDFIVIVIYIYATSTLLSITHIPFNLHYASLYLIVFLPLLTYHLLWEVFNEGQSIGKKIMRIRVVKADGSTPSISSYLLRWLLFIVDGPLTGGLGLLAILLTKKNQRLGDLAAGTIVVKEQSYRKIAVSLDEFNYLDPNYRPAYPQAGDLSLDQINVITRTLHSSKEDRHNRIEHLAKKITAFLGITSKERTPEEFLQTILRDYQYYALEEL